MSSDKIKLLTWKCPEKGCDKIITSLYQTQLESNAQDHMRTHKHTEANK